jgi:hypothetical protein
VEPLLDGLPELPVPPLLEPPVEPPELPVAPLLLLTVPLEPPPLDPDTVPLPLPVVPELSEPFEGSTPGS